MAINKVKFGENTLIDLTEDTVSTDTLLEGYTAHDKTGNIITGTKSFNVKELNIIPDEGEHYYFGDVGFTGVQIARINTNNEFVGSYFASGSERNPADQGVPFTTGTYAPNGYCKSLSEVEELLEQGTVAVFMEYNYWPPESSWPSGNGFELAYDSETHAATGEDEYLSVTVRGDSINVLIKSDTPSEYIFVNMVILINYSEESYEWQNGIGTYSLLYEPFPLKIVTGEYSPNPFPGVFTVSEVYSQGNHLEGRYWIESMNGNPDRFFILNYDSTTNIASFEDDNIAIRIENETVYLTVKQQAVDGYLPVRVAPIPADYIQPSGTIEITRTGNTDVRWYEYAHVASGSVSISGTGNVNVTPYVSLALDSYTSTRTNVYARAKQIEEGSQTVATISARATAGMIETNNNYFTGNVKMILNKSLAIPAQPAKTITPTKSSQTAIEAGKFASGTVTVAPIPDEYIVPAFQERIINPSTTNQVITPASGYDGLSKVTVIGDSDLIRTNIKKDVNIFGVTGIYEPAPSIVENVSQDEDGYIVFDDESGAQIIMDPLTVTENGTYTAETGHAFNPVIANVSGGEEQDEDYYIGTVRFIDYDGSTVYSCLANEVDNMASLPDNPVHEGLVSQGWNYTLEEIKDQVALSGECTIGQMYLTSSGNTEIDIELTGPLLTPYLNLDRATNNSAYVTIDWGDGSDTEYHEVLANMPHTYSSPGSYTITINNTNSSNLISLSRYNANYVRLLSYTGATNTPSSSTREEPYSSAIKAVRIGRNCVINNTEGLNNLANLEYVTAPSTSISDLGNYHFYGCRSLKSFTIPRGITNIGRNAFEGCNNLEYISIPPNVTTIGESAFSACSRLNSITIPSGVTIINAHTFDSCRALKHIILPDGVTDIGAAAFSSCYSLSKLTIPDNVTYIGSTAFSTCYSLKQINIPDGVTYIDNYTFSNCSSLSQIILPEGITNIGNSAFSTCSSLRQINIPDGVTRIGSYAFSSCRSLKHIEMPNSVTTLGGYAFNDCVSLCQANISSGITNLQTYAFANCFALSDIVIPNGVTDIGNYAFVDCYNLRRVTIPNTVTTLGTYAFSNCQLLEQINIPSSLTTISSYAFRNCYSLRSIVIPYGVTSIGSYAFEGCSKVQEMTIPSSVTSIGQSAFSGCSSLQRINIPDSVSTISGSAFRYCYHLIDITLPTNLTTFTYSYAYYTFADCWNLQRITIPAGITTMGSSTFYNSTNLREIHMLGTTPPTLSNTSVIPTSLTDLIIYVPYSEDHSVLEAYKTATTWSTYASKMQEEPAA